MENNNSRNRNADNSRIARILFSLYDDEIAVHFFGARYIAAYKRKTFFNDTARKMNWVNTHTTNLNEDWNLVTGFVSLWDSNLPVFITNVENENTSYWLRTILGYLAENGINAINDGRMYPDHFLGHGDYGTYTLHWVMDYLSRVSSDFTEDSLEARRTVFDFRDGVSPKTTARMVAWCIRNMEDSDQLLREASLVCIPSATQKSYMERCRSFSRYLASDLRIKDCIKAIDVVVDREPMGSSLGGNKLLGLCFHANYIQDANIILFDDVYHHGESFRQISGTLLELGAKKVTGICLAKTYKGAYAKKSMKKENDSLQRKLSPIELIQRAEETSRIEKK